MEITQMMSLMSIGLVKPVRLKVPPDRKTLSLKIQMKKGKSSLKRSKKCFSLAC
jgi:hypothetical protein